MGDDTSPEGLRDRLARSGEDALGKLAQDLLDNPLINGALSRAFEAREKASQAQELAMGALNIPSAADIERLTRRVRSVSQRLEGIEDGVDRLDEHIRTLSRSESVGERLEGIEQQLAALTREVEAVREALPGGTEPVARGQERLRVGDSQG
jgi:predicted  nucleic acid-binding Zn-ribbon protein